MPAGRPKKIIDADLVRAFAERHWTKEEIAAHFHVDVTTIHRKFAALIEEARQSGKAKLRDAMWSFALGNPTKNIKRSERIFIHLSDRVLGPVKQDPQEVKHAGEVKVIVCDYREDK